MRSLRQVVDRCLATAAAGLSCAGGVAQGGELEPGLAALARMSPRATSAVIIELDNAPAMDRYASELASLPRADRPGRLAALMQTDFNPAAEPIIRSIKSIGGWGTQSLWIAHSIAAQVPRAKLVELAAMPGVKRVDSDTGLRSVIGRHVGGTVGPQWQSAVVEAPAAPEGVAGSSTDSLEAVKQGQALNLAPHFLSLDVLSAWQGGHAGKGVTVAVVDTGVDLRATTIARGFRGRAADWFDPYGQQQRPVDFQGHGTLVAGLLVGGLINETPVGVAPQARWVAARLFDDAGRGSASAVQRIYQWVLDPDGKPSTADAPDIVNNSWGLPQSVGRCNTTFARALAALRAADIHVVFAAGNDGPASGSSMSPANNPGVLSVGALTADRKVAARSSRGPSGCGRGVSLAACPRGQLADAGSNGGGHRKRRHCGRHVVRCRGGLWGPRGPAQCRAGTRLRRNRSGAVSHRAARVAGRIIRHSCLVAEPALRHSGLAASRTGPGGAGPGGPLARAGADLADKPIEISSASLQSVLPWSVRAASIRPIAAPSAGRLTPLGDGWTYAADSTRPEPVRFDVETRDGRKLVVELVPQAVAAASPAANRRQAVRTQVNGVVLIPVETKVSGLAADALRVSSPLRGGKVRLLGDGKLQYTPPVNFIGVDQFTYSLPGQVDAPVALTTVLVQVLRQ